MLNSDTHIYTNTTILNSKLLVEINVFRQQEYAIVLCWTVWCAIHALVMVVLTVLSFFTLLRSIPTRVILHVISALLSVWSILVMLKRHRLVQTLDLSMMTYVLFQSQKPTQLEHGWKGAPGRDEQAGRVQGVQHALADSANETQHLTLTKSHCGTYFIRYLI